ncbi:TetR family transcriptional regulator, partial [Streptomyces sp. NPDC057486]
NRRDACVEEVDTFLQRATHEGLLRPDLPHGWANALLPQLMHLVSRQLPELSAAQAADVVVDTLLRGLGAS